VLTLRAQRLLLAVVLASGCARMAPPPGGPPDGTPPVLLGTVPDSVRVLEDFDGWVEFRFDEVISEGAQPNFGLGNGELERLVLVSPAPDSVIPRVQWKRERLLVRPKDGWRANTVYRIELSPGIRDVSEPGNVSKAASVVTFTTGGALPTRILTGRAVDWGTQRPLPTALIEALLLPDSLPYRTLTDSTGRFAFGPLPQGEMLVRAVADQNRNRRLDGTESWDTVRLAAGTDRVGEIWAYPQDTLPPRIQSVARVDSFSIAVTLSRTLPPGFSLPADSVSVLQLPDSASIGPRTALMQPAHDSLYPRTPAAPARPPADSVAGDTTAQRPAPPPAARPTPVGARGDGRGAGPEALDTLEQKRPKLTSILVIRTSGIVQLGVAYGIELRGVRTIGGGTAAVLRSRLETPKPTPRDTTTRRDSTTAKPDSTAVARPDALWRWLR
jgi:hypothetical protein